jgi:Tol biopolymer transport system component
LKFKGSQNVPFNPIFSNDSKKIIFTMITSEWPNTDLYYLDLTDSGYDSVPKLLDTPINSPMLDFGYFIDRDSTIYFTGKRDDFMGGTFDVYSCKKENGRYITKNMKILNSELDDAAPYLSPDGSYLVYEKMVNDDHLAYNDSTARIIRIELFVSFRDKNNEWGKPINLGSKINSKLYKTYRPVISPDGKYLFYSQGCEHGFDVYWVSTKVIDRLKPK